MKSSEQIQEEIQETEEEILEDKILKTIQDPDQEILDIQSQDDQTKEGLNKETIPYLLNMIYFVVKMEYLILQ